METPSPSPADGMVTIRDIRAIITQPSRRALIVVKVETSVPELYGLGCATFTQRPTAVKAAVEDYLPQLLAGRDVDRIEDIWQTVYQNAYWRNGPVLNNALSGLDMALWDIKGKRAGMPLYQLLGGRCRQGAAVYRHAHGREPAEVLARVQAFMDEGCTHVRAQIGGYGGQVGPVQKPDGAPAGAYFDRGRYMRLVVDLLDHLRTHVGWEVELLHDVHERLAPSQAVQFARDLEPYRLYFLEDPLAPEDIEYFHRLRQLSSTPIAMGELFNHPLEWTPLISQRLIDFIRMHISQMGGITPARKVAAFAELHHVRTAWHGPGDVSPVGHAANLHLDLATPNFGIQEFVGFTEAEEKVFPGCPQLKEGVLYPNDLPGLGIDLDEEAAARYPYRPEVVDWTQTRLPDGTSVRP